MKLSKHNYSQYSKQNNEPVEVETVDVVVDDQIPTIEETVAAPEVVEVEVEETVEPVASAPETVTGVVSGCSKLNVRVNPCTSADVVCVLDAASEIEINIEKSTDDWFSVCTATGIEGYCMRKFVEARL